MIFAESTMTWSEKNIEALSTELAKRQKFASYAFMAANVIVIFISIFGFLFGPRVASVGLFILAGINLYKEGMNIYDSAKEVAIDAYNFSSQEDSPVVSKLASTNSWINSQL